MVYIIIYTISSNPNKFYVSVDNLVNLALEVDRIMKKGVGAVIKIYETTSINYNLSYKDKSRTVIDKIPEIEIL